LFHVGFSVFIAWGRIGSFSMFAFAIFIRCAYPVASGIIEKSEGYSAIYLKIALMHPAKP